MHISTMPTTTESLSHLYPFLNVTNKIYLEIAECYCGKSGHYTCGRAYGALDSHAARKLLDTFAMLCREYSATILMVTHDVMAASFCDRILFMKDGEIKSALNREQECKQTFFAEIFK